MEDYTFKYLKKPQDFIVRIISDFLPHETEIDFFEEVKGIDFLEGVMAVDKITIQWFYIFHYLYLIETFCIFQKK